ncbi:MAG: RNA polymerase sigma-70 factor [Bacteroidetes bacterium]|nr:RNA polymerase sigma-70 factor [Bacteroidota bacterium]
MAATSADIVQQLMQRDQKAFELVFRTYYAELCHFANKYLKSEAESEELVQDVFCRLWQKLDSISIQTSLKSYLYSSVRNASFNFLKHQLLIQQHAENYTKQNDAFETDSQVEVGELQSQIAAAISKLPDRCREVFMLSRQRGLKYREIADEMNISVKTVEVQMGKALSILRKELQSYLPLIWFIWLENLK